MPTKLEQLQLQFRQKLMQEKEERMIKIHTDSQQKALSKVTKYDNNIQQQIPMTVSVVKKPPPTYTNQPHQSPIKKGSPGVDRSRPLPPLQKEQKNHYNNRISPASTPGETTTKTVISNGSRSRSVDLEIKNVGRPPVNNGRLKQRTDSNRSLEVDSYPRADPERIATNVDYIAKLKQAELQRMRANGKMPSENTTRVTNGHPTTSFKSSVTQKSSPPVTSRQSSSSRPKPRTQAPVVQKRSPAVKPSGVSNNNSLPRKPPNPNQEQCKNCGRNFNKDRIEKHVLICVKTSQKKRKVFDVTKMRVQGTEAESFVKKRVVSKEQPPKPKKTNWKKQHEEFIATIRQAKEVQRHLAAGGKVSDLPPPPPSDTSHYVPCPYCGRKFNEGVAERHIPKCKNILSNKKPPRK